MRLLICILVWTLTGFNAQANDAYLALFVNKGGSDEKPYSKHIKGISAIWQKYQISLVTRFDVDWAYGPLPKGFMPDEIILLKAATPNALKAYLEDNERKHLLKNFPGITDGLSLVTGSTPQTNLEKFLKKTPLIGLTVSETQTKQSVAHLSLQPAHGENRRHSQQKQLAEFRSLEFHAISYDDNPLDLLPDNSKSNFMLVGKNWSLPTGDQ